MTKQVFAALAASGLMVLLTPISADAYGAAHVGYTHVGPNGAYHVGGTAAVRPGGVYTGNRSTVGYDRAGYGDVRTGYGGVAYGNRAYAPGYDSAHYAYVR